MLYHTMIIFIFSVNPGFSEKTDSFYLTTVFGSNRLSDLSVAGSINPGINVYNFTHRLNQRIFVIQ